MKIRSKSLVKPKERLLTFEAEGNNQAPLVLTQSPLTGQDGKLFQRRETFRPDNKYKTSGAVSWGKLNPIIKKVMIDLKFQEILNMLFAL